MRFLQLKIGSIFICSLLFFRAATAQQKATEKNDTLLHEVVVHAFNSSTKWKDIPAAIAVLNKKDLEQYSPASLVPIMNTIPGIRMEERSPGSYRLSVRGSLLRSPFGVRNIKVYWNGIPLSDATGNTYLNLLDITQVDKIEIAKGPSASIYGAGTGGALLLENSLGFTNSAKQIIQGAFTGGSFGYNQQSLEWISSNKKFASSIQLYRLQSNGYREQSAMLRSGLQWRTITRANKNIFRTTLFYTDLFYQTPGGITIAQMQANPIQARQAAGVLPGAVIQKTAIYNKTFWGALQHEKMVAEKVKLNSFLSINKTLFENPFITNYEKRNELNLAVGMQVSVQPLLVLPQLQWVSGFEWMVNESGIRQYNNNKGIASSLLSADIIVSKQGFIFTQLQLPLRKNLLVQAGFSINQQSFEYKRLNTMNNSFTLRKINAPFVPRLSITYKINSAISTYAILAKGFSAPSLAEIRPSDGNFYPFLNAEKGWNVEAGIRGALFHQKLLFDIGIYQFKLQDAIVRRNDAVGAEYFINAGNTRQSGLEALLKYRILQHPHLFIRNASISASFSYQPYIFMDYKQGSADYSGNALTGVPKTITVVGFDISTTYGYVQCSINATSKIPLNDANTLAADAYQLLQAKIGRKFVMKGQSFDFFIGGDNLLNHKYSLGNDINAAGNRYFNPAALRNWYAGLRFSFQ
ncbi:MAG: TonB-dependent receptor [Sphingobacteriia bacterium]|nr:MAG: TonB-dependent receptor [Sphingobacteriia bacterium]